MHRCGGANRRETQLPPRCNGQAIVRSIARQMLSLPKLAKRCGRAPKARSPGNAAMRSHLDIPRSAPPAPPRLNDRKLLPWVRLPTHAGLSDRTSPGPKPRLTPEQEAAVAELVRKGPDLAKDGVVRWRRVDLAHVIKTWFNVTLAERSVGAMSGFGACRCGRVICSRTRQRRRHTKKLCRSGQSRDPRACARTTD